MERRNRYPAQYQQKLIMDPIHGHMRVPAVCLDFVDTPEFQRLHDLKQLGSGYFVFPGASHNRFEHSLGVCHLAGQMIDRFKRYEKNLEITRREQQLVRLAGLLHDIGHGPFSHQFDSAFIPRVRPNSDWSHEKGSCMLIEYMVDQNNIEIDKEDLQFVQDLILASETGPGVKRDKGFLYDIVANGKNGVDVDKFDYLARDSYNLGMKFSWDYGRVMEFTRVIDDDICFQSKAVYMIYELFHTRASLHKQVYSHPCTQAIDFMLCDIFTHADQHLKISSAIDSAEDYVRLTDCILKQIETSRDQELRDSQALIKRLRKRDLYCLAEEGIVDAHTPVPSEQDLASCAQDNFPLSAKDIIIKRMKIDYGKKNRNPVENVRFFHDWNDSISVTIPREKVSALIPESFMEITIRVYAKDKSKRQAAQMAFRNYLRRQGCKSPIQPPRHVTPSASRLETPSPGASPIHSPVFTEPIQLLQSPALMGPPVGKRRRGTSWGDQSSIPNSSQED